MQRALKARSVAAAMSRIVTREIEQRRQLLVPIGEDAGAVTREIEQRRQLLVPNGEDAGQGLF